MRFLLSFSLILCCLAAPAAGADEALSPTTLAVLKEAIAFVKVEKGATRASGSAFLIRVDGETGYLVTNHHVVTLTVQVERMTRPPLPRIGRLTPPLAAVRQTVEVVVENPTVTVVFGSGTKAEQPVVAEVVASDPKVDLAVLKVRGVKKLPAPIDLKLAPDLAETLPVFAVGFPLGQALATSKNGPAVTLTKGTVSSIRRNDRDEVAVVQIDSDLNPGNSGGPVVDARGRLVGVAVAKVGNTRIGFAIPPRELAAMLDGRVGEAQLHTSGVRGAMQEVRVEVSLVDPLERIKSISLIHAPAAALKGKSGTAAAAPLKDGRTVELKREGRKAVGTIAIEVAEGDEAALTCQVAWVDNDGRKQSGEAQSIVVKPATPAPIVEKPAEKPAERSTTSVPATAGGVPGEARPKGRVLSNAELTKALADLLDSGKMQAAAELLASAAPSPGRRAEVAGTLQTLADEKSLNVFARAKCIKALGVWNTDKTIDALVAFAADDNIFLRTEALESLGWIGGAKAAAALAARIENIHDHDRVIKCLTRIGSAAEQTVVDELLQSSKVPVRIDACKLLKAIGTKTTLPAVESLARDDPSAAVKLAAEQALKSIKERAEPGARASNEKDGAKTESGASKTAPGVTKANLEAVKNGMSLKEVEEILGKGQELPVSEFPEPRNQIQLRLKAILLAGGKGWKFEDGRKMIIVIFKNDKVVGTSARNL